jgi:hypothetical protein
MPAQNSILKSEAARIKRAIINLQPLFPGKNEIEILSNVLAEIKIGPIETSLSKISRTVKSWSSKSDAACTPEAVLAFAKAERTFSSKEAQKHFKVSPTKMAGSLASLSRQGILRKLDDAAEDGTSAWRYVGKRKN